jgi:acetylornithine aminotransferase
MTAMHPLLWYPGHELILEDIVRARDCYLFDARGKRYLDFESGVWCTSIGHCHPRILAVIAEQSARIAHAGFNYSCAVVLEAARGILALLGLAGGKCVFLCSGSEAVEYGVRVIQSLSDRPLLMTMTDSYFGAYGSASAKRGDEWHCFDWSACAGCRDDEECGERCPGWAQIPFERIGGFLFEPGSSSGLVRFPPRKLVASIARRVKADGGFILVNEVTTGIGRTGAWFGHQHYGIEPDVVAMGKGLGNGYPVSATAFGPRVIRLLGDRPVRYAQSHQNDPLGAVVAREVLRIIAEEGLIERSRALSSLLLAGLERVRAGHGRVKAVRGRGLMAAVELEDDAETTFTTKLHRTLIERGVLVGKRPWLNVLRIDPPLTVREDDIAHFMATLEAALADLEQEG